MTEVGAEIFTKLLKSDYVVGGKSALFIGGQGSGKTSILWKFAVTKLSQGELVIVRERDIIQTHRIPGWEEKVKFFAYKKDKLRFVRTYGTMEEELNIKTTKYITTRDILKHLEVGKINAIIEPTTYKFPSWAIKDMRRRLEMEERDRENFDPNNRKSAYIWAEMLYTITHRHNTIFANLFLDELHEVFPQKAIGMQWYVNQWATFNFADLRKMNVNFFGATHNLGDIYYEMARRTNIIGYLRGAKMPPRLSRYEVYLRKPGKMILTEGGAYGLAYVQPFRTEKEKILIERKF